MEVSCVLQKASSFHNKWFEGGFYESRSLAAEGTTAGCGGSARAPSSAMAGADFKGEEGLPGVNTMPVRLADESLAAGGDCDSRLITALLGCTAFLPKGAGCRGGCLLGILLLQTHFPPKSDEGTVLSVGRRSQRLSLLVSGGTAARGALAVVRVISICTVRYHESNRSFLQKRCLGTGSQSSQAKRSGRSCHQLSLPISTVVNKMGFKGKARSVPDLSKGISVPEHLSPVTPNSNRSGSRSAITVPLTSESSPTPPDRTSFRLNARLP